MASGAALQLQGGITVSGEALTIAGSGTNGATAPGALRNISGTNTYAGAINLSANSRIGAAAGTLNLTGGITGTNLNLELTGAGDINVTNTAINLGTGTFIAYVQSATSNASIGVAGNTVGTVTVYYGGRLRTDVANAFSSTAALLMGSTDNSTGRLDLNGNNQTFSSLETRGTGSQVITSASAATLTVNGSSSTTFGGVAGAITGAISLVKAGSSTLTLTGNNTYTGNTTVAGGTLLLSGNGTLGTSTISISGGTLDMGGKSLTNTLGSLTGGTLSNGTLTNNGGNYDLQNGTVSAILAGTNGVNKTGSGTVTLSGANTYNGTTTIAGGTLLISGSGTLGTSTISLSGGTLDMGGKSLTNTLGSLTGGTLSNGTITNNGSNYDLQSGTVSAILAGTNGVNKTGSGTVTLSNTNNYSGSTSVVGGTLLLSGNGTLGTSTISLSGGTLDMGGKSLTNTLGSLTGGTLSNGTLTNNGGNYDLQNGTVSAILAGTNGVNKTTSGTVTLSNANTYNGTTTVNSGTLTAAAAGALGNTSKVFLNNGGSLLVTTDDAIGTNTAVELNGGRLAVNGTFDESVGALTLSANSVIDFSGFVGTLRFSGVGSWASGANLAIWNWSGQTQYQTNYGTYPNSSNLVFTNNATLSNNLANISFYSGSGSGFIGNGFEVSSFSDSFGSGSLIIAVPEPETYITAVALLLGFTFYQIRLARHGQGLLSRVTFLRSIAKRRKLGGSASSLTRISNTEGL